jgi:pyridoxal phosphate enzyme (YggS family)
MSGLSENFERVQAAIDAACLRAGRLRSGVELMAVSKTYPAATLAEAASLGMRLFGENRVQEFTDKSPELREQRASGMRVHLIGHLQSNKSARAAELFDAVDSLDSLRLAERLNEAAGKLNKRLPVLVEVKISTEETKAGIDPESPDAAALLERLPDLPHLDMQGLMTIAPWGVPEGETRACFRSLREWRDRWSAAYPRLRFDVLSMGMSGDFAIAIEEGSTRVRIGTALFGKRPPMAAQRKAYPEDFTE